MPPAVAVPPAGAPAPPPARAGRERRRWRSLDESTRHARQGASGSNYVQKVLAPYRASGLRIDREVLLDQVVEGSKVGDVDFLLRDTETGRAILLEVKTSSPRFHAEHRRQAARAAEAVRVADSGGCLPIPVVVYVDADRHQDGWKRQAHEVYPEEPVYPVHRVHLVGARNLKPLIDELLDSPPPATVA